MSQIQNSFLGGVPASGPQALFTKIELIPPAATVVDLKVKFDTGLFMGCQAVYIDALDSAGDIEMTTSFGQRITARKGTQGYYPILEGTEMRFTFKTSATSQDAVTVFFLNQPIAVGVWGETILPATAETLGLVMIGSGITVSADGTISVAAPEIPIASDSVLGGVKIGAGLSIDEEGVLSATGGGGGGDYSLPIASPTTLGGIKIGTGFSIDPEGVLSVTGGGGGGGLQSYGLAYYIKSSDSFMFSGLTDATQTISETSKNAAFKLPSGLYLISLTATVGDIATGTVPVLAFFDELYEGVESELMSLTATIPKDRRTAAISSTYYFAGGDMLDMVLKLPYNYRVTDYSIQFFKLA